MLMKTYPSPLSTSFQEDENIASSKVTNNSWMSIPAIHTRIFTMTASVIGHCLSSPDKKEIHSVLSGQSFNKLIVGLVLNTCRGDVPVLYVNDEKERSFR